MTQDKIIKKDVTFNSGGFRMAAHLYYTDKRTSVKQPAIIVGHPASGVKEQTAGLYAAHLASQGFVTLTFDTATQGESEGTPRGVEDPARRVEEFKQSVSFLATQDMVDVNNIAVLGICASGGYVVSAAVSDHRIKAVATVSGVDLGRIYREGPDGKQGPEVLQSMLDAAGVARSAEENGQDIMYFPIFESEQKALSAGIFMLEGWDYYCTPRAAHPRSAKQFTLTSIDKIASFDGFQFVSLLAPRPLLVVIGSKAVTLDNSMHAFDHAQNPKEVFWVDGASHMDLYDKEQYLPVVVAKLTEFFHVNLNH